jgi:integrase/recombinase XerD
VGEQLRLLREIAAKIGVTLANDGIESIGLAYMRYRASKPRGRAWQMERGLLRPLILRYWRAPVSTVGPAQWEEHRRARRKQRTRLGRPPCELTLNLELAAAKRLLPALKPCKFVKTRTRRESWFTADQIDQLLEASSWLRWDHQQRTFRALVSVMADTGLRISSALSLRWDRITLRGVTSVVGKGAKPHVVALTPRAIDALSRLDRHHASPLVFTNWKTLKRFNPSTVRSWFRQAIKAAKLEGVKADGDLALVPHTLRHSAASIADERGAPAQWIQQMLNHTRLSTTQVYLHRSNADAALRMAAIMSGRRSAKKSLNLNPHLKKGMPVSNFGPQKRLLPS